MNDDKSTPAADTAQPAASAPPQESDDAAKKKSQSQKLMEMCASGEHLAKVLAR